MIDVETQAKQEAIEWSAIFVLMAVFGEIVHALLFGVTHLSSIYQSIDDWRFILIQIFFPFAGAVIFMVLAGWLNWRQPIFISLAVVGLVLSILMWGVDYKRYHPFAFAFVAAMPLGCYLFIVNAFRLISHKTSESSKIDAWVFFCVALGSLGLGVATNSVLAATSILFPLTYDIYLTKIDEAFWGFGYGVAALANTLPLWFNKLIAFIYALLTVLFFPLVALMIRDGKVWTMHGWRTMVIPFFVAVACYAWLPAAGPIFLFGETGFPGNVLPSDKLDHMLSAVAPAPRNAMPSMHLSGALWVMMIAAALRWHILLPLSIVFVIGTAWATLSLGQHYVIDLVVAMPFAAWLGVLLIDPPSWKASPKWLVMLHRVCGFTFATWMILLRFAPMWLHEHLAFVRILSAWSVGAALVIFYFYIVAVRGLTAEQRKITQAYGPIFQGFLPAELGGKRWLVYIFFFSGFAGLLYEVVYAKALGVTFGGTALAATTVLTTYMGGMALGAWFGGILAERSKNPLKLYAIFEAVIGLYAAATPWLFSLVQSFYVAFAVDAPPDSQWLTLLRMGLGVAVLGIPTVLMGATLPLVFQCLKLMGIPTGRAIAPLYGANVLGAAAGSLVASYVLLPAVGRNGGTLIAAVVSLMVALFVLDQLRRDKQLTQLATRLTDDAFKQLEHLKPLIPVNSKQGQVALLILGVGGVITLALEVVFIHLLAVVAGNSVYAFGLMLATFLAGLGLGSTVGERLMRTLPHGPLVVFAQLGLALTILMTAYVWDGLADYMGSFGYSQQYGIHLSFAGREYVRALVCALAMLPPALCIGLSYPATMALAADWLGRNGSVARGVGTASGVNTLGNIAGVLAASFWWLPQFGSRDVLCGLMVVALLLAAAMAWAMPRPASNRQRVLGRWAPLALALPAMTAFPSAWNYTSLSQGGNVYFYPQSWGSVIDHAESVEGGLTTVARHPNGTLTLLTNGKFQGNNAQGGEMVAQESIALIPLLHTTARDDALVVGYGTGMTARVLHEQGFKSLEVVELSSDIVKMADRHFENINGGVSNKPEVIMHYTDGRNFLLTQTKAFDLISMEISSIWFAGAANLYNQQFYQLAKKRLKHDGVLQQWIQLHHMRPIDFLYVLGSIRSVFKYVWIYESGGQGIIVASNSARATDEAGGLRHLIGSQTVTEINLNTLPDKLIANPSQVDQMLHRYDESMSFFISTDNNLYLEYSTPKGNAIQFDSAPVLKSMLRGER